MQIARALELRRRGGKRLQRKKLYRHQIRLCPARKREDAIESKPPPLHAAGSGRNPQASRKKGSNVRPGSANPRGGMTLRARYVFASTTGRAVSPRSKGAANFSVRCRRRRDTSNG